MATAVASSSWRLCVLCLRPLACWQSSTRVRVFSSDGSLTPSAGRTSASPAPSENAASGGVARRSADPDNELREYIEYSKINSWHSAVGRRQTGKERWKYERLVIGVCGIVLLAYIYIRPENSTDEQFDMSEFGRGLFRPHPAMEHHIAATIEAVEARGGDASAYRNQLKILLKEKEAAKAKELQESTAKLRYDPEVNEVKY